MTNVKASTIRPGLLVSLKTSIKGGVSYRKTPLEVEQVEGVVPTEEEKRAEKARWETERTITDAVEHEAAVKARSKARAAITGVCTASAFGLLCPAERQADLDKAIAEARKIADDFNSTAQISRVTVYVIAGRVAGDDVEAVRAISSEVRDLLSDMEDGVRRLNVEDIRKAANSAKEVGAMLSDDMKAKVEVAVEAARSAARKIVKAGETAATEINSKLIWQIQAARTQFLDLDEVKEVQAPEAGEGRALDLIPSETAAVEPVAQPVPAIEL